MARPATWEKEIEAVVAWIRERVSRAGARGCVVGLSGGIDSSVVGALCRRAFPETTLGVIMPFSVKDDDFSKRGRGLAGRLDITTVVHPIGGAHAELAAPFFAERDGSGDARQLQLPLGNLRSRLRMCALYLYANAENYFVVGTGNKDEDHCVGYFTKYGDGGVDISPIADFHKSEVYELGRALGVPDRILDAAPSAGLWDGQTDEDELGMTYAEIEAASKHLDADGDLATLSPRLQEVAKMVADMRRKNRHKLEPPPVFMRKSNG